MVAQLGQHLQVVSCPKLTEVNLCKKVVVHQ